MHPRTSSSLLSGIIAALTAFTPCHPVRSVDFQGASHPIEYEREPILYSSTLPTDPVTELQIKINEGKVKLTWDERRGYLPSILEALGVSPASQMLVASKSSLQRNLITPDNPRSLFFNDDVYIGYIPGAPLLEISAVDPDLGAIFFSLAQSKTDTPEFQREGECLRCHASSRSMGVPGHVVRSLAIDATGEMLTGTDTPDVDHTTPLEDRWGGWYVTGLKPGTAHRGNRIEGSKPPEPGGELKAIRKIERYLRPQSGALALAVHDHQTHMHNYIARVAMEARIMLHMYGHLRYMKTQVESLVRYLVFAEEAPLNAAILPDPDFISAFTKNAIRDSKGRSLKDFDLEKRLFKYPCSFLIYSDAFERMPEEMRQLILKRLLDVLTSENPGKDYESLSKEAKRNAFEILLETKIGLPPEWKLPSPTPEKLPD
jgi:hypothetical protein